MSKLIEVTVKVSDFLDEKTIKRLEGKELNVDFVTEGGVELSVFVENEKTNATE